MTNNYIRATVFSAPDENERIHTIATEVFFFDAASADSINSAVVEALRWLSKQKNIFRYGSYTATSWRECVSLSLAGLQHVH